MKTLKLLVLLVALMALANCRFIEIAYQPDQNICFKNEKMTAFIGSETPKYKFVHLEPKANCSYYKFYHRENTKNEYHAEFGTNDSHRLYFTFHETYGNYEVIGVVIDTKAKYAHNTRRRGLYLVANVPPVYQNGSREWFIFADFSPKLGPLYRYKHNYFADFWTPDNSISSRNPFKFLSSAEIENFYGDVSYTDWYAKGLYTDVIHYYRVTPVKPYKPTVRERITGADGVIGAAHVIASLGNYTALRIDSPEEFKNFAQWFLPFITRSDFGSTKEGQNAIRAHRFFPGDELGDGQ